MKKETENVHTLKPLIDLCREIDNKKPAYAWRYRRAYLGHLNNYWNFAVALNRVYKEKSKKAEASMFEDNNANDELISASISFYFYIKICLDASRVLSDNTIYSTISDEKVERLQKLRKENKKMAQIISRIRNKVGAHPGDPNCLFVGDVSWGGVNDRVKFFAFDLRSMEMVKEKFELNPDEHLLKMKEYINNLMGELRDCWGLVED